MIALKNGKIYTMAGEIIEKGTVLIEHGKIRGVGEDIKVPKGCEVINVKGMVVMPGLIDAHTHVGIYEEGVGEDGEDTNEMTDPVTPELRAIDAINPRDKAFEEARQAGITTIAAGPGSANVIGGQAVALKTYGDIVDDMIIKAPSGLKVAFGENPKRVYGEQRKSPSTRMAIAAILRGALMEAQDYIDKMEKGKKDPDKLPDRDLGLEALAKVLKREIPLRAHAHRADDIMTAIRIAREFNVDISIEHCTEGHKIAGRLAKEKIPAVVGPSLIARIKIELNEKSFKTPGELAKAGVKVALMTDHPVIPIQYLPVCAALAVKEGMDEYEALKAITINAAEIIGIQDRVGSIEKGKDADIAVFDGNPIDIKSRPKLVLIDGKVVYNAM